jgi:hypothetical protein
VDAVWDHVHRVTVSSSSWYTELLHTAYLLTGSVAAAEDLVQTSLLKLGYPGLTLHTVREVVERIVRVAPELAPDDEVMRILDEAAG